jgi:hypothetical protein
MKTSRWTAILFAALLAGCGDRNVVLKVDLASHLAANERHIDIPSVPVVSGGLVTGEQALVADQNVNMLGGLGDAILIRDVQLAMGTVVTASTGSGTDTIRVYVSDEATDPATTSPVVVQVLTFTPGAPDSVRSTFTDTARLTSLFAQKALRLRITTSLRGPASGNPLVGDLTIQSLEAVVVAARKRI